jgi:MFS family permease
MVLALILFGLTATGVVEVWHVIVLALGLGITNSFDMPARQAFSVEMVGREDVPNAVGFNSAQFNASRIFGPALAGILIAAFDLSIAFLINALSYVAVIAAYLAMRSDELRPSPALARPTSVAGALANLAEGVRYVRHTPVVLLAVTVLFLGASFGMNFQVLIPPLADETLGVGASGYGFLMAASGLGSTVAAVAVAMSRRARLAMIALGALTLGLGLVVLGWSTWFPLSLAMMAISGAGAISMAVTGNTTIQLVVPDMLRGRVMSVWATAFSASVPVGGLLMGAIASAWDAPAALVVGGVLTGAVGAAGLVWTRPVAPAERPEVAVVTSRTGGVPVPVEDGPTAPVRRSGSPY